MSIKSKVQLTKLKVAAKKVSSIHALIAKENWVGLREIDLADFVAKNIAEQSFPVLVGSGWRSTLVHAKPTKKIICRNDLIVIDCGAKADGYCSDMTRTIAATKMSAEQGLIHEIVQQAQTHAISQVQVGISLQEIHRSVYSFLFAELRKNQILQASDEGLFQKIFPHKTSHWIGTEVHEKSPYLDEHGQEVKLSEGMVFTIEPGLYFHPQFGLKNYSGIGVRIEDMVVLTRNGAKILTR